MSEASAMFARLTENDTALAVVLGILVAGFVVVRVARYVTVMIRGYEPDHDEVARRAGKDRT